MAGLKNFSIGFIMFIADKIKDLFGIEHHPYGTLRIAEYADGTYSVERWQYGHDEFDGIGWYPVYLDFAGGKHWARYLTLDEAKELKERLIKEDEYTELSNKFVQEIR